jgi:hypothetical protein
MVASDKMRDRRDRLLASLALVGGVGMLLITALHGMSVARAALPNY